MSKFKSFLDLGGDIEAIFSHFMCSNYKIFFNHGEDIYYMCVRLRPFLAISCVQIPKFSSTMVNIINYMCVRLRPYLYQ